MGTSRERLIEEEQIQHLISGPEYAAGFESYFRAAEEDHVLRPHQREIFTDIQQFYALDGPKKGYVTAPTGTGKTVVFVELSKAIIEAGRLADKKPRILVVEPTIELVNQTLGRSTDAKGYGQFAPDLTLASYFSDSTADDRRMLQYADVVGTTYDSLALMSRRDEVRDQTEEEKNASLISITNGLIEEFSLSNSNIGDQLKAFNGRLAGFGKTATGRTLFDLFDVVILDEAHHIIGNTTGELIDKTGPETIFLGFTATPDANEKKRLSSHLPVVVSNLTPAAAVSMGLLAPVASIGLKSGTTIEGGNMYDSEGDFNDARLGYLVSTSSRNRLITDAARILVDHGLGTLISCIPGEEARHAKLLADELNYNGVSAAAVHSGVSPIKRKDIYEAFEHGEIDVLTNIKILGEGWDSARAKAWIAGRPTRSLIDKRQFAGRVLRPGDSGAIPREAVADTMGQLILPGNLAVIVDIMDDFDVMNPPLFLPDIVEGEDMKLGEIYGEATPMQREFIDNLVAELGKKVLLAPKVPAAYSKFFDTLAQYPRIVNGRASVAQRGHFITAEKISPQYRGLTDSIIRKTWQMSGKEPEVVMGVQNFNIRAMFEAGKTKQLLNALPVCETDRAYKDKDERWMSAQGFMIGFSKEFPHLTQSLIEERLLELGDRLAWRPLKAPAERTSQLQTVEFDIYKAYRADKETIGLIRAQLKDFYELIELTKSNI